MILFKINMWFERVLGEFIRSEFVEFFMVIGMYFVDYGE